MGDALGLARLGIRIFRWINAGTFGLHTNPSTSETKFTDYYGVVADVWPMAIAFHCLE